MVNPDTISHRTLDHRNDRPAHNSHIQEAGSITRQRSKVSDAQGEDTREHNGVEQPNCNYAPHCDVSGGKHGNRDQRCGTNCAYRSCLATHDPMWGKRPAISTDTWFGWQTVEPKDAQERSINF